MVVFLSFLILYASKIIFSFSGGIKFVEALIFGILLIVAISAAVGIVNGFIQDSKTILITFDYRFTIEITLVNVTHTR